MNFRSILQSSKLEIIKSKRIVALGYLVIGLLILMWWIGGWAQVLHAYYTYGQFDTSVTNFILVTVLFFFPLLLVGALMLHSFILRFRLLRWLKHRTVIADYSSGLSPAEAGTLVDLEYTYHETWATLLNLHFRRVINLEIVHDNLIISTLRPDTVSGYERTLLNELFGYRRGHTEIKSIRGKKIIDAGHRSHKVLVDELEYIGALKAPVRKSNSIRNFILTIYCIAGLTAVLQIAGMLTGGDEYWGIAQPRYDMHPVQFITMIVTTFFYLAVVLSVFWIRLTGTYKSKPEILHLEAAGYHEYLKRVYRQRFDIRSITTQNPREVMLLVPYIIAYRLVKLDEPYLQSILEHTNNYLKA